MPSGTGGMNSSSRCRIKYDTHIEQGGSECFRRSEAATLHCACAAEKAEDPSFLMTRPVR